MIWCALFIVFSISPKVPQLLPTLSINGELTGVEGEFRVDLSGYSAWNNLEDFGSKLSQERIHGVFRLVVEITISP